ncbi:hypothetical protein Tco_0969474 [Tanacetum coccineum]
MVLRAVLMKYGLVSINITRQVNAAHTKTAVNAARPMSYLSKIAHSTVKRPIHKNTTFKNSNFNQRVNIVKDKNVNTVRPKEVVNAAKPKAVVNTARPKAVVNTVAIVLFGFRDSTLHTRTLPHDYVPGPEEPEHAPPLPDFVPEPVYLKFMPPDDDVLQAEEQPLLAAISPTAFEEESSEDDADDKEEDEDEDEDEDEEEEEQLAPADSVPPPTCRTTAMMSIRDQTPIPFSPTHPLGYIAAMIRLRAESPSTSHPLPLPPSIVLPHTKASIAMMRAVVPSTYILEPRSGILPSETPPSGIPPLQHIPLPTLSPPLFLPSTDCWRVIGLPRARLLESLREDLWFCCHHDDEFRRDLERDVWLWGDQTLGMRWMSEHDEQSAQRCLRKRITTHALLLDFESGGHVGIKSLRNAASIMLRRQVNDALLCEYCSRSSDKDA